MVNKTAPGIFIIIMLLNTSFLLSGQPAADSSKAELIKYTGSCDKKYDDFTVSKPYLESRILKIGDEDGFSVEVYYLGKDIKAITSEKTDGKKLDKEEYLFDNGKLIMALLSHREDMDKMPQNTERFYFRNSSMVYYIDDLYVQYGPGTEIFAKKLNEISGKIAVIMKYVKQAAKPGKRGK